VPSRVNPRGTFARKAGDRSKAHDPRHMPVGTMSMRTVVPGTAPAVQCRKVNLRQGSQVANQLELSARAALCRELAKREPANRDLWTAEAEKWSRLSNRKLRGCDDGVRQARQHPFAGEAAKTQRPTQK